MHISKVELENIKSHAAATFHFSKGTTAITGENGAGKTTIIEAIAWAMFDVLEYKKEDFVRRGSKKGSVSVTFESGLDEREYIVYRDTGAGYYVTDPQLQTRIAVKKEEVFRFLWQHLGLEPGTDLKSLFRQAIGVPQGTFTAIFLDGAAERKMAFDRLLKVEEYRQAAEKLRETVRYVESQIASIREGIARAEGELSRADAVGSEHKTESERAAQLGSEVDIIGKELERKKALVAELDLKERRFTEIQKSADELRSEKRRAEIVHSQSEQGAQGAAEAARLIETVRTASARHLEILGKLTELERERHERDRFRSQLAETDAAIVHVRSDQKRLLENIEAMQNAHMEIAALRPKIEDQERLESDIHKLRDLAAGARSTIAQIASLDDKLGRLRESYKANQSQLTEAEAKTSGVLDLAQLEQRDAELHREAARLRASLERDERFQSEIKNGFCPILTQKCLNLQEGQTLEAFVSSQFTEFRGQIATIDSEHGSVAAQLAAARQAQQYATALAGLRSRAAELKDEGTRMADERSALEKSVSAIGETEHQLALFEGQLRVLDDPRSRVKFLENETRREIELRAGVGEIESNIERLENDRHISVEQLEAYKDLDENWASLTVERESTAEPYRTFIANEAQANALGERRTELETAKADLAEIAAKAEIAQLELLAAADDYDRELHLSERSRLLDTELEHARMSATLDAVTRRTEQLAADIERFAEIRRLLAGEFREKERLEKVAEATAFIRDALKEAAPRVARNYVYHVSLEANMMYREITGNAERTLKWAEDYAIMLEEDGHERPFQSLSGGEQMAAALSVRLALLKQLTDIRIAFFDEPTTNMDATRRENLAMEISRITHFDQLFVISHDETFDSYVDNVVAI
ncbi:MAG: SMC family ATPase [Acidobacteriota bacterium]